MALVLDTSFLVTHTFPPTREDREKIREFVARIRREKLLIPSIVVVEYIKVVGKRIGKERASVRLRSWIDSGAKVVFLTEELAFKAGELALKNPNAPLADVIISVIVSAYNARVISSDLHFNVLGIKTIWYKRS